MSPTELDIKEFKEDQIYRISAAGDLIITNARTLQNRIDHALQEGASYVTINLCDIQYIDSFGIGVIVKTKSDVDKKQGNLRVQVNPTLYTLFEKCHLDDYIHLEMVSEEAEA
jgi:anti-anti-sigma factor